MDKNEIDYTLITTTDELNTFYEAHQNVEWMAFDTEFISEMRYYPQLCLIQVASDLGLYLIDTLELTDISLFLELIENENILKITHAGGNDYRLFYTSFNVLPKSVYDVQVAAGFVGYRYPLALDSLLFEELGVRISKSQKISNWAERPFSESQIKYALIDVIYLRALFDNLNAKLEVLQRKAYADEEMTLLEKESAYQSNFLKNLAGNPTFMSLPKRGKVFYIRLHEWREAKAEEKNLSKNMVFDNKVLIYLTKNVGFGLKQLHQHRRIPNHLVKKYGKVFLELYEQKITVEEEKIIKSIPRKSKNQKSLDLLFNQIDLYVHFIGRKHSISPALLLSRTELNKIKAEPNYPIDELIAGWRKEILGKDILHWLKTKKPIEMVFEEGKLVIG